MEELEPIEGHLLDEDRLAIPTGMPPVYAHRFSGQAHGRMIVHVRDWSDSKEFDQSHFDVYSLAQATVQSIELISNGVKERNNWYSDFKPPIDDALMQNGKLIVRVPKT